MQFEFGEDSTSPVKVASAKDDPIDVESIADRIITAEFDSEDERDAFLQPHVQPTNISEYAGPTVVDARAGVESDD